MKLKFGHLRCYRHDPVKGMPTSLSAQSFPFLLNIRERVEAEVGVNDLPLSEHPLDTAYSKLLVLWPLLSLQGWREGFRGEGSSLSFLNLPPAQGWRVKGWPRAFWCGLSFMKELKFAFKVLSKWSFIYKDRNTGWQHWCSPCRVGLCRIAERRCL